MELRDATPDDLPGILAIYNDVIAHSTAVYADRPVTLAERRTWFEARRAAGYPVLVMVEGAEVLGFGSFGAWRSASGYAATVEHSVHVRADQRRRGVGQALVAELVERARGSGKHVILGAVDAANAASLALHERLGFERAGLHREVARKFDRWLDLVFVQRRL